MAVTAGLRARAVLLVFLACWACGKRPEVEAGTFFPTWSAEGAVPAGIVQGVLVERDGCLLVAASGEETLVLWDDGMPASLRAGSSRGRRGTQRFVPKFMSIPMIYGGSV